MDLYTQALRAVRDDRKCSTSFIQRKLAIGYNKASSLIEKMEEDGIVSKSDHIGKREVLADDDAFFKAINPPEPDMLERWSKYGETGASSRCIAQVMTGVEPSGEYPIDAADFGRCEKLMDAIPSFLDRFYLMAEVNIYWQALHDKWSKIRETPPDQRTALIKSIINPIQDKDPNHVRLSEQASVTFGKPGAGHNSGDKAKTPNVEASYRVTADELRQFIERIERLEQEKKDIMDHQKEVMAEAKGRGYDTKVMRKIIALRKRDPNDIAEEDAVTQMYKEALGMG